jgi:aryl-alcohol dehydrogenase-like predicted oxidoreductase
MERRSFLKKSAAAAGILGMGNWFKEKNNMGSNKAALPKRPYGRTDVQLSIIGFGGIVVMNAEQKHANNVVAESVEKGVNYFDVAPTYGDAEVKLGPALEPYRKDCFLACKTGKRDAEGAKQEMQASFERLKTDYFDLYQLHAITDVEKDVEACFAKGGCMETIKEAKKNGQIRYVGFSAHSEAAAMAAMENYDFDSILFPVNFATFYEGKFGPKVIAKAKEKGMSVLALKALAHEKWPENDPARERYSKCWYKPITDPDMAKLALNFTLTEPVTSAVPPGEEVLYRMALNLAMDYQPVTNSQVSQLKQWANKSDPIFPQA